MTKIGEAFTYDRSQAEAVCYQKRNEGYRSKFTSKKVGNRRLYTIRWYK